MKKQIVHISVHQTSKVIAAMHAVMFAALFILPTVVGHWLHGQLFVGTLILILLPLFIWLLMYIGYAIACWFYNLIIPWIGGIEVEVIDVRAAEPIVKPIPTHEIAPSSDISSSESKIL
jgi:hypothetical protein